MKSPLRPRTKILGLTDATDALLEGGHVDLEVTDVADVLFERGHVDLEVTDATDVLLEIIL